MTSLGLTIVTASEHPGSVLGLQVGTCLPAFVVRARFLNSVDPFG